MSEVDPNLRGAAIEQGPKLMDKFRHNVNSKLAVIAIGLPVLGGASIAAIKTGTPFGEDLAQASPKNDQFAPDDECIDAAFNTPPKFAVARYVGDKKKDKIKYKFSMPAVEVNGQPCDEQRTVFIGAHVKRFHKDPLFPSRRERSNDAFTKKGYVKGKRYCGYWKPSNSAEQNIYKVDKINNSKAELYIGTTVMDDEGNRILNQKGWDKSITFKGKKSKVCEPHATFKVK